MAGMRVVLIGQKSFGAAVYEAVRQHGHRVAQVYAPDLDDKLALAAVRRGDDVRWTPPTAEAIRQADADVIVAAHSHAYIGRRSRAATALGAIGYHPSLLPRHRGRDAVRWTVAMGDPIAGGSVYWFTDNVDGGPIAAQEYCHVSRGETHHELWREKLFPIGVRLTVQVLADLDRGRIVQIPQDEQYATWEPSWDRPPLYRPELPEIGSGPSGYEVIAHRSLLQGVV